MAVERLDLVEVVRAVVMEPLLGYGDLVDGLVSRHQVSVRSVKDALSVLVAGGWLESQVNSADKRRRNYVATPIGSQDLGTLDGHLMIHSARRYFSACSPKPRKARRYRKAAGLERDFNDYVRSLHQRYR